MILLLASPAFAEGQAPEWQESVVRGLQSYTLNVPSGGVSLTCDPDRVFGPSSNATLVARFGNAQPAGRLVVLAQSGEQAAFTPEGGIVSQVKADPEQWEKMVEIISAGGDFALVTSSQSVQFEAVPPLPSLKCD